MTNFEETVSAILDGECSPAELDRFLDACDRSPALMRRFGRHSAAREAHIGTHFHIDGDLFCATVMDRLDPPRLARVRALRARARSVLRPVGGLALAASLGALVTFAVYRFGPTTGVMSIAGVQPASQVASAGPTTAMPAGTALTPVADTHVASANVPERTWSQLDARTARHLDDYMMEHASYRSGQAMNAALNYARMAAQGFHYQTVDGSR